MFCVGFIYLLAVLFVQGDDGDEMLHENRGLALSNQLAAFQQKRIKRTDKSIRSVINVGNENSEYSTDGCRLTCSDDNQRELFKELIMEKNMIRLSFTLNFRNLTFIDPANSSIVNDNVWTLFYDGKDGSKQYLYWPIEAMVWSFGLLSISSDIRPRPLTIATSGLCSKNMKLRAGDSVTNNMIGQALAEMTNQTLGEALQRGKGIFQKMYWCYMEKAKINDSVLEAICQNIVCPFIMTQYICCQYNVTELKTGPLKQCKRKQFRHADEWWSFPFMLGIILFIHSPFLLLLYASAMVRKYPQQSNISSAHISFVGSDVSGKANREKKSRCTVNPSIDILEAEGPIATLTDDYITYEVGSYPVTVFGTLFKPFQNIFPKERVSVSRTVRFLFPFLCLSVIFAEILIDLTYLKFYVESCVEKSIPLGFRTLIVGIKDSRHKFLSFLGGPYFALVFYVGFMWITLLPPKDCGEFLSKGLQDYNKATSPMCLPITVKEILGSVQICNKTGYEKILNYTKAHIFMLINGSFWHLTLLIYQARFRKLWNASSLSLHKALYIVIFLVPALILLTLCLVETTVTVIFYSCPIICFGLICTNSVLRVFKHLITNHKSFKYKFLKLILAALCSVMFLFGYYLHCLIFLESFLFLTRVALFTYSAVIRYPKESYGIITLAFMTLYYLLHSFKSFGETYVFLLEITVRVVKKLPTNDKELIGTCTKDKNFYIAREFYEYVITNTRPRRVQMLLTAVKTAASLSLVSLSAILVRYFDKYRDLSVIIQVLTIMLVCALPLVIRSVCSEKSRERQRRDKIRTKIRQIAKSYIEKKKNAIDTSPSATVLFRDYGTIDNNGYENI